jgi:hypothetical protein
MGSGPGLEWARVRHAIVSSGTFVASVPAENTSKVSLPTARRSVSVIWLCPELRVHRNSTHLFVRRLATYLRRLRPDPSAAAEARAGRAKGCAENPRPGDRQGQEELLGRQSATRPRAPASGDGPASCRIQTTFALLGTTRRSAVRCARPASRQIDSDAEDPTFGLLSRCHCLGDVKVLLPVLGTSGQVCSWRRVAATWRR